MNEKFANRLKEYLDTECSDYGLSYKWEYTDDCGYCAVEISREHTESTKELHFKYDEDKDDLLIELCEDSYYATREFDWTVKYFWMLISPAIFKNG